MLRLGSLFSGSGGFELAGSLCGIEPVWASEVEPYPIAVTKSRFPNMKHLGSVTDVHGGDIEPVDIITFGSPCQDLSVAGKRAGLKHEANGDDETTRSGLFMEAVRIIEEMRKATNGEYPTFAVWENVPGAFSSNKGEDFRTVLEELIKIVEPTAVMPAVPKNGWPYADSYCGDGWSLAYRVFDAQYWGVPQRRRRIYLVIDLRGQRAGKVSFEREGVRGNFAAFKTAGQGTAGDAANRTGADDCEGAIPINTMIATRHKQLGRGTGFGVGEAGDPQFTISAGHEHAVAYTLKICDENILDDQGGQQITVRTDGKSPTLRAETHGNLPAVMEPVTIEPGIAAREGGHIYEGVCGTLRANAGDNQMAVAYAAGFKAGQGAQARSIGWEDEKCPTLAAEAGGNSVPSVCIEQPIVFDKEVYNSGVNATGGHYIAEGGPAPTLRTSVPPGVCVQYIVRRLTPTECARLQGFPDDWGHPGHKEDFTDEEYRFWLNVRNTHAAINGKPQKDYTKAQMLTWYNKLHTDSAEYKLWGNGISLPTALYVMQGIAEALKGGEC